MENLLAAYIAKNSTIKPEYEDVSKEAFELFIDSYPRPILVDTSAVADPPVVSYNDFSLGCWPNSVVASLRCSDIPENSKYSVTVNTEALYLEAQRLAKDYEKISDAERESLASYDPFFTQGLSDAEKPENDAVICSKPLNTREIHYSVEACKPRGAVPEE